MNSVRQGAGPTLGSSARDYFQPEELCCVCSQARLGRECGRLGHRTRFPAVSPVSYLKFSSGQLLGGRCWGHFSAGGWRLRGRARFELFKFL